MARYAEKAVNALQAHYAAQIATRLRAVEVEAGLAEGALPNPVDVVRSFVPADNRSPLLQIFDNSGRSIGQREVLSAFDCTVALTYTSGVDLEAAEDFMRRYLTAMIEVVRLDPTLGGQVSSAWWTDTDRSFPMVDESATRHTRAIGVEVHVHP